MLYCTYLLLSFFYKFNHEFQNIVLDFNLILTKTKNKKQIF